LASFIFDDYWGCCRRQSLSTGREPLESAGLSFTGIGPPRHNTSVKPKRLRCAAERQDRSLPDGFGIVVAPKHAYGAQLGERGKL